MSDKQLCWVQLHVSALGTGHHQFVLRLIEQLYNKQGVLGGVGVVGGRDLFFVIVGSITLSFIKILQPDDGLYTRPKHVVVPNVVYHSLTIQLCCD